MTRMIVAHIRADYRREDRMAPGDFRSLTRRMVLGAIVCGTLGAMSFAGTASADWPVYGHDLGNSRSVGTDGPTAAEAPTLQRAWTFNSSNGDFTGTPVVAGGTLVAGTNLGTIYGLDAVTGKVRA